MANVAQFGNYSQYVIESATVDRLGIVTMDLLVPYPDPVDLSKLALSAAPTGVAIPCVGVRLAKGKGNHGFIFTFDGKFEFTGNETTYELEGADSNEPIETHPDFLKILKKYGGTYNADGSFAGFPSQMPGDPTSKNPLYGQSDFISIGWVWSKSYTAETIPETAYSNAGYIDTPDWGDQEPQELTAGRDFLKLAPRCTWRGNVWKISERWQASGINGINKDVYGKRS